MSLGFLTESALLPSKSKPIQVDSRSQIPLKAIVAEELSKKEAKESLRGSRGKKRAIEEKRKDIFQGKNKGVEDRKRQDQVIQDQEDARDQREFTYMNVLKKKAEEYDRLARGEKVSDMDDEDCLVDFSRKRKYGESPPRSTDHDDEDYDVTSRGKSGPALATEDWGELGAGEVEITDEFGRTRRVSRKSEAYKQYKEEHRAQRQHEAIFGKKGSSSSSTMDPSSRTVARGRSSDDEEQRGAWAWSRGDEEEAGRRENKPREPEPQVPKPGEDGAILTQWDRKLHSQAREYLQEVIAEEKGASGADDILAQKQREKEERLAKLRQKLQRKS